MDAIVYDKVGKEAEKVRDILYGIYPQETITDAAIASFSDGADNMPIKSLVAQIEPVQDLHGYDSPWPGGGNYNKLPITLVSGTYSGVNATVYSDGRGIALSGTKTDTGLIMIYSGNFPDGIVPGSEYIVSWGNPVNAMQMITYNESNVSTVLFNYANSTQATVTIPADAVRMVLRISLESATAYNTSIFPMIRASSVTETAYVPYENICPISGWTGAEITGTGVNVWDEEWRNGTYSEYTGIYSAASDYFANKNPVPVKPNTSYYFGSDVNATWRVLFYDKDFNYIHYTSVTNNLFRTPSNCHYVNFNGVTTFYGNTYDHDIRFNYPATDTTYHPYTGSKISVTFPSSAGTVYGGTLTLNPDRTGTMVVDSLYYRFTGSEPNYVATGDGRVAIKTIYIFAPSSEGLCTDFRFSGTGSTNFIYLYTSLTAEEMRTYMATHEVYAVVKLATPTPHTLTASEVSGILTTLYGTNNIWASTGNIEKLTYRADLGKYIDSHITTAVANALNA